MPVHPSAAYSLADTDEPTLLLPAARVTVTIPGGRALDAPLGMAPLVIGTSGDCDISVVDAKVSRRHCELRLTSRGIVLRDLGSKNGTIVGELQIIEAILPIGVTARVGNSHVRVSLDGVPSAVPLSTFAAFGDIIGRSVAMRALFARLEQAAAASEPVLLVGETGTGKARLARAVHAASSRRDGPFVVMDCGAVAPGLMEVELFGRGGLLEQAHGGTLFIDEVGELPPEAQPKLARAMETRKVRRAGEGDQRDADVRVVAATHRSLRARVAEGWFHADLYTRLATAEVRVPPLRDRKEDIPLLVERYLAAQSPPRALTDLPPYAMDLLAGHDWPGNLRELHGTVARLMLAPDLPADAIAPLIHGEAPPAPRPAAPAKTGRDAPQAPPRPAPRPAGLDPAARDAAMATLLRLPLRDAREMVVSNFERSYLAAKLRESGGDLARTAEATGASPDILHRLLQRYDLRQGER
jgi:DNA-binding NtrC family response regulator